MKTLQNLLSDLSRGELRDLHMSGEGSGSILPSYVDGVVLHVNDVLTELYTRVPLRVKECLIEMQEGMTNYHLDSRFAASNFDPDLGYPPYILDLTREQFEDDVIKIMYVFTQNGQSLPINDTTRPDSVYTPETRVLQIPFPMAGDVLSVSYQAMHNELKSSELDAEIALPSALYPCLRQLVASRIFNSMDGKEGKAIQLIQLAEKQIGLLESSDALGVTISQTNQIFDLGGWC